MKYNKISFISAGCLATFNVFALYKLKCKKLHKKNKTNKNTSDSFYS